MGGCGVFSCSHDCIVMITLYDELVLRELTVLDFVRFRLSECLARNCAVVFSGLRTAIVT